MAQTNITSFWLKRIAIMVAVMACAIAFLLYVPESGTGAVTSSEGGGDSSPSVATNVTRFYKELMSSKSPIQERYGDFVVVLEEEDKSVGERIARITEKNYPPIANWSGEHKERPFASGSTLRTEASNFVSQAGYTLVWDLSQDFIIRDRFVSDGTLVGMLEEISGAVDANFDHPIGIYFCFKKRAIVITVNESEYLQKNCEKSTSSPYQQY